LEKGVLPQINATKVHPRFLNTGGTEGGGMMNSMPIKRWMVAALLTIFVVDPSPRSNAFSVERCHLSPSIKRHPMPPQTICFMVDAQDESTSEAVPPLKTKKKVRKKSGKPSTAPKKSSKGAKGVNKSTDAEEPKVKRKTKKIPTGPMHWIDEMDETALKYRDPENASIPLSVQFKVRGEPRPLVRHRSARGFMYNPSAPRQESFRNIVQQLVYQEGDASLVQVPLFAEGVPLVMKIVMRTKRPKNHFVASRPGPDRMREKAPDQTAPTRSDVDNLGKLVLDALNGLLYHDDRQIISLHLTKLLDNDGLCKGSTEVYIRSVEEDEVDDLILNSFQFD
jgi:Holliday junction resolvase RusA-like endonuclease